MSNATARFNLNSFQVVGPRQTLIVALLAKREVPMTASQVAAAFKLPRGSAGSILTTLKSLVHKGYVVMDTAPAKISIDGCFYGAVFTVTPEGSDLARRMGKVKGLGNRFALVLGRRPAVAA